MVTWAGTDAFDFLGPNNQLGDTCCCSYEFYVNGSWVHFKAVPAGTVLRVRATGARDQSDGSAPAAGEIVFLS